MAIPASQIVSVVPRLIQAGGTELAINGLVLTKNELIPSSVLVVSFASAESVGEYFGFASDEYRASEKYFLGYDNSFTKPRTLLFARRIDTAVSAKLRGAKYVGTLAQIKAVTDGAMTVTINGTVATLTALDFSEATSFSGVADIIETALDAVVSGATVAYSSQTGAFEITSPTVGNESSISFATDGSGSAIASMLNLTETAGAILSNGLGAMTVAENFSAVKVITDNWVTFTTLWDSSEDESLALAEWATAQGVDYLYVCHSTAPALVNDSASSIADTLKDANVSATAGVYGSVAYAMFIMAIAASIDWNRNNGVVSFAHKQQSGLPASIDSLSDAVTLEKANFNFYGKYATRNDEFLRLFAGSIFGDYRFIDPYVNAIWLKNVIQVSVMVGLGSVGRVPYNAEGYAIIRAWIADPIKRALRNGVIDTGVTLSESQKAQLVQESGRDLSEELFTNGYALLVDDSGANVRVNRDSPTISLYYTYGGSVNRVEIASTAIL